MDITNYKIDTKFPAPFGEKVCIYKLLGAHLDKGEHRHDAALRIMGWYHKDKQFGEDFTWAFLNEWSKSLKLPLSNTELKHIFKSIPTINYNLCKDPFMEKYCC